MSLWDYQVNVIKNEAEIYIFGNVCSSIKFFNVVQVFFHDGGMKSNDIGV